ncbi:MAG: type II toxin-antitoxin system RelE/ParE family toxin [Alphaproteobacteria bacterium]|nr:MAG: type II toxin-antitoxin system RelE/ParE family toxin [Alphaproteobacteria bacterium]
MFSVLQTETFERWLDDLRDRKARAAIRNRLLQIEGGLLGDIRPLGGKVSEIRIHQGPGYRLYFTKKGLFVIVLLCGGDKGSQSRDLKKAKEMAAQV